MGLFDELVHMPTARMKGMVRLRGKLNSLFGSRSKSGKES
jgi:hypothetical protein